MGYDETMPGMTHLNQRSHYHSGLLFNLETKHQSFVRVRVTPVRIATPTSMTTTIIT